MILPPKDLNIVAFRFTTTNRKAAILKNLFVKDYSSKRAAISRTLERHANLSTLIECSTQGGDESLYLVRINHPPVPSLASM